jgi:hypothetical protein
MNLLRAVIPTTAAISGGAFAPAGRLVGGRFFF